MNVRKFQLKDKLYLKSASNVLYDIETREPIGMWDPKTDEIMELSDDDDDDDDEELDDDDEEEE